MSYQKLTQYLINGYKILNGVRYFSLGTLQNLLIYFSYKKYFRSFTKHLKFYLGNLYDFRKKVLKI